MRAELQPARNGGLFLAPCVGVRELSRREQQQKNCRRTKNVDSEVLTWHAESVAYRIGGELVRRWWLFRRLLTDGRDSGEWLPA